MTPMDDALDFSFIENYGIDAFNAELLLGAAEVSRNKFLSLMELEDPSLPMLCPLAKALFYLDRPEFREHVKDALECIRVVDPNESAEPTSESVHHVIKLISGEHEISLEFRSHGEFIWASEDEESDDTGMELGTLANCAFSQQVTQESLLEALFRIPQSYDSTPMGEPVDHGPFVCFLTYCLYSVNGIPLKQAPEIKHSTHDLEFVSADSGRSVTWPHEDSSEFDWTNLLDKADREVIFGNSPCLADQLDAASLAASELRRLTVGEIQQSYSSGVKQKPPIRLEVMVGSGADWYPGLDDDEVDDEGAQAISFPSAHPPILGFSLPLKSQSSKKDFERIFPAIKLLVDATLALE